MAYKNPNQKKEKTKQLPNFDKQLYKNPI